MPTLADQVQVQLAKRWQVAVGIILEMLESVAVVDKQPVVLHFLFVEDGVPDAEVLVRHVVGLVTDNDLYAGRARAQRADRQPAVVRMCPENLVRVVVRTADEKCEVPVADGRRL